jgi:hypothetical protein
MAAAHIAGLLLAGNIKDDGNVRGWDNKDYPIKVYDGPGTPPPPTKENLFSVLLRTDSCPEETAFTLTKISPGPPTLIASRSFFSEKREYECSITLPKGTYQFDITDSYGDGLLREAYFTLSLGGNILKTGGQFYYLDRTVFSITKDEPLPPPAFDCQVTPYAATPSQVALKAPKPVKQVSVKAPKPVQKKDKKPKK